VSEKRHEATAAAPFSGTLEALSNGQVLAPGGTAAALTASVAASLIAGVTRAKQWEGAGGALAQADALRTRLALLSTNDAEAYTRAVGLLARARSGGDADAAEGDGPRRDHELAVALEAAASVPLAIAEAAADVAALAEWVADAAESDDRAEARVALCLAEGAAGAAAELVLVNLRVRPDDELAHRARAAAAAAAQSRTG
jgi:methenyltetrahydrofolate cyclohydrolase